MILLYIYIYKESSVEATWSCFSSFMIDYFSSKERLSLLEFRKFSESYRRFRLICIILASILGVSSIFIVSSIRHISWKPLKSELLLEIETDPDSFLFFLVNCRRKCFLSHSSALLLWIMKFSIYLLRFLRRFLFFLKRGSLFYT